MKIEGLNKVAMFNGMGSNEEVTVQKKIESLKKELNELEKRDELSQEEIKKKQELERQIAELEQKLQQIKDDKVAKKAEETNEEKSIPEQPKEDGKGENVDERI